MLSLSCKWRSNALKRKKYEVHSDSRQDRRTRHYRIKMANDRCSRRASSREVNCFSSQKLRCGPIRNGVGSELKAVKHSTKKRKVSDP